MSILEELREQAQKAALTPEDEGTTQKVAEPQRSAREAYVERRLLPAMGSLFDYFKEFNAHLSVVKPEITADYELEGLGPLHALRADDFELEADETSTLRGFAFQYVFRGPRPFEFKFKGAAPGEQQKEYLSSNKLRFRVKPGRNVTTFIVEAYVPVRYEFSLDYEREAITLAVHNAGDIGALRHTLKADTLTSQLMDELAKHMLCKVNRFNELTGNVLSETGRFRIRDLVEKDREQRASGEGASFAGRFKKKLFGRS